MNSLWKLRRHSMVRLLLGLLPFASIIFITAETALAQQEIAHLQVCNFSPDDSLINVIIDGNPARVIDLSMIGAQVLSATSLRPNQRIRISMEGLRFNAAVAWASFELPAEGPRYHAGINFQDANAAVITRLLETITTSNHT